MEPWEAGSESSSYSFTNPNNELTHQWMMEANAFNAEQAEINRNFQREMSNTAYQRAMSDLAAAGLNPILAGSLGPASTPGGNAATANFTGAGATTTSSSHSVSRSIGESVWNMGMSALNEAGRNALGDDLATIVRNSGQYVEALLNKFTGSAMSAFENGADSMQRGSGTFAKHNPVPNNRWNNVNNPMAYNGYGNNGMSEDDYMHYAKRHNQYRYGTGEYGENEYKYQKRKLYKRGTK